MKTTILTLGAFFFLSVAGFSQMKPCCAGAAKKDCDKKTNTAEFAALGDRAGFSGAHNEPVDYEHVTSSGKKIDFPTEGKDGSGFFYDAGSDKYLFVFHEWWGLNDHIKREGEEFYKSLKNVNVLCLDLYDGRVADTRERAQQLMQGAKEDRIREIIDGAIKYAGDDARVSTVGWCFGGGWSLRTALMLGNNAESCVMYYGMPVKDESKLEKLSCPVLGVFAEKDDWINPQMVQDFEQRMQRLDKEITVLSYEANHAFANPSNPSYDKEAAGDARKETMEFLKKTLEMD